MSAPGTTGLKTLDVGYVSQVVRALLHEAGRELFIEDTPRRDLVPIPFDAAAAEDGLLPVFLVAGEAIWRDVTGQGLRSQARARPRGASFVADRGDRGRVVLARAPLGDGGDRASGSPRWRDGA
jgi:hypothetical protein